MPENKKESSSFLSRYLPYLLVVLTLHLIFLRFQKWDISKVTITSKNEERKTLNPLTIRKIKTNEVKSLTLKTRDSFINPSVSKLSSSSQKREGQQRSKSLNTKNEISLNQLSHKIFDKFESTDFQKNKKTKNASTSLSFKQMNQMNLEKIKRSFLENKYEKQTVTHDLEITKMIEKTHQLKDAVVSIENPDGVELDQLNKYELKFYGFQRRVALQYINSILDNINEFQKKYPQFQLSPNDHDRLVMTARITYDQEGNVTQIKMVRWTKINEIQNLFEDIVQDIDQLQNPPEELWNPRGEFSMFYTLDIIF